MTRFLSSRGAFAPQNINVRINVKDTEIINDGIDTNLNDVDARREAASGWCEDVST